MVVELIQLVKKKNELKKIQATIQNMSCEEKNNINQVINYAVTWWLKDLGPDGANINTEDSSIDDVFNLIKEQPISDEDMAKLDSFKSCLGYLILEELLKSEDAVVELHCGYSPEGILSTSIGESGCEFLNLRLPRKARMRITRKDIYLKEGHTNILKFAFDVSKGIKTANDVYAKYTDMEDREKAAYAFLNEALFGDQYVSPNCVELSKLNFFENNCQQLVDDMSLRLRKKK